MVMVAFFRFGIAGLFLSFAFGQNPDRVLQFTQDNTTSGYQEISNLIRSVADVQGSVDTVQKTISISGAPDNVAAASWIFYRLDAPGGPGSQLEYKMPGAGANVVRLLRLTNAQSPTELQSAVNLLRSVLEVNRMFALNSQNLIAVRGTEAQTAAVGWLIAQLDQPIGPSMPDPPSSTYRYEPGNNQPTDLLCVFYLKYAQSPTQIQELVNAIRSLVEINRLFPYNQHQAAAARGTESQIAAAKWLIQELDKPVLPSGQPASTKPAVSEYRVPQGGGWPGRAENLQVMRVFRLANADTPQSVQTIVNAVRAGTNCNRLFGYVEQRAIAMMGTDSQAAAAERLITELDVPAVPKPTARD
jgi:hypothetical protein